MGKSNRFQSGKLHSQMPLHVGRIYRLSFVTNSYRSQINCRDESGGQLGLQVATYQPIHEGHLCDFRFRTFAKGNHP